MIFKIKNLGNIKEAEVDLGKDLILLTGQNNTGKTYLAYSIYKLFKVSIDEISYISKINIDKNVDIKNHFIKIAEKVLKERKITFNVQKDINAIIPPLKNFISKSIAKNFHEGLDYFFSSPENSAFINTQGKITFADNFILNKALQNTLSLESELLTITRKKDSDNFWLEINSDNIKGVNAKYVAEEITSLVIESTAYNIFDQKIYIAPSERAAINIFSKELSLNKNKIFDTFLRNKTFHSSANLGLSVERLKRNINRYPQPVIDNLEISEDLANLSKNKSRFAFLAEELEHSILRGQISVSEDGELMYLPNTYNGNNLEMHVSSSLVKSLANIVFYFRHLAEFRDWIIIDEPELNLHPDNQRLIARFLGRLVNEGFKVIISTHSDYIIKEINNLIMLSRETNGKDKLMKKYGYNKNQLMKPEQVEALLFKTNSNKPSKIPVSETGLTVETIDEVINALDSETEDIYFHLFEKEK